MFIKPFFKYNKSTRQRYTIYSLCESYRINGSIRHRSIIGLGKLEELETEEEKKLLGSVVESMLQNRGVIPSLFPVGEEIEKLAYCFYSKIKSRKRYDAEDWETVKMSTLKNKDAMEIGAEWLSKQAFDQLGIGDFLSKQGWSDEKIALAATHIISRAVFPASELKTVSWIKENSAVCEITGFDKEKITKDSLYSIRPETL